MTYFKDRLRAERKRLGLSQEKFAALAGVTKDTQLNYESGTRKPDSDYLIAICGAGVDSHFLIHGTPSADELPAEESELLIGFRKLDLRAKLRLLGMIDGMTSSPGVAAVSRSAPPESARYAINPVIQGDVGQTIYGDISSPNTVIMPKKDKKK